MNHAVRGLFILSLITSVVTTASACPSCFGAKDSPMTAGMNMAILAMLGIIGSVLLSFIVFFIYLWRRYKRQQSSLSTHSYVNENGDLKVKNEKGVMEWNNF